MFSISHSKPPQGLAETKQQLGDTRQARFWCAQLIKTSLGLLQEKTPKTIEKKHGNNQLLWAIIYNYSILTLLYPIIKYDYPR